MKANEERETWQARKIALYYESDAIDKSVGGKEKIAPDPRGARLLFVWMQFAENLVRYIREANASGGIYTFGKNSFENIAAFTLSKRLRTETDLAREHVDDPVERTDASAKTLEALQKMVEEWKSIWISSKDGSDRSFKSNVLSEYLRKLLPYLQTLEEEHGTVQGTSLAPSKDYNYIRSYAMYQKIVELAASRNNVIYKVGDTHIGEMDRVVDQRSPRIAVMDEWDYRSEYNQLRDALFKSPDADPNKN